MRECETKGDDVTAGIDEKGNLHDENGQFISIGTLFERERVEHGKDHERELIVAKETAQRLEREVEQTALRLERVVEETALRIEKAVQTALAAVAETARVHSDAHQKEHLAHERIHTVEKDQVEKAEKQQATRDVVQAKSLEEYKKANNEWSSTVRELTSNFPQRLEMEAKFQGMEKDIKQNSAAIIELRETVLTGGARAGGKTEGITTTAKAAYMGIAALGALIGIVSFIFALMK